MQNNRHFFVLVSFFIFNMQLIHASEKAIPTLNLESILAAPSCPPAPKRFNPRDRKKLVISTNVKPFEGSSLLAQAKKSNFDSSFPVPDNKTTIGSQQTYRAVSPEEKSTDY